ncbi:aminomethyltransferase [Ostertagia ostertagi]
MRSKVIILGDESHFLISTYPYTPAELCFFNVGFSISGSQHELHKPNSGNEDIRIFLIVASGGGKRTCLFDFHNKHGGKIVPFAGYEMPVQYPDLNIQESCRHTREHVSIFDVSHMLQTHITGKGQVRLFSEFFVTDFLLHCFSFVRVAFIESLTTADVEGLPVNSGTLSVFTNEKGGIKDDLIVSKTEYDYIYMVTNAGCIDKDLPYLQMTPIHFKSWRQSCHGVMHSFMISVFTNEKGGIKDDLIVSKTEYDYIYMVTNAGCIDKDLPYLQENAAKWRSKGKDVDVKVLDGRGLIAVQGPEMMNVLQKETDINLRELTFMRTTIGKVFGISNCRVTRCGYTGEDGVEISVDPSEASTLAERLLQSKKVTLFQNGSVKLAGLGARDALRLEAGLCLYGNDIDENTTPIEAGLAFVVAKRRRETLGFPGAEKIVEQLTTKKWPKQRVGLVSEGGRAPRAHLPLIDPLDNGAIGFITSGCPSPCLNQNIAMGYVDKPYAKAGTKIIVDFGAKQAKVTVTKMPFVKTKYYTKAS